MNVRYWWMTSSPWHCYNHMGTTSSVLIIVFEYLSMKQCNYRYEIRKNDVCDYLDKVIKFLCLYTAWRIRDLEQAWRMAALILQQHEEGYRNEMKAQQEIWRHGWTSHRMANVLLTCSFLSDAYSSLPPNTSQNSGFSWPSTIPIWLL